MSAQNIDVKAYDEKISGQLQQTKSQLSELEARAKSRMAQAEVDTASRLKTKHQEIDRKRQNLKTVGDSKLAQAKAEIDADVANLKNSLAELNAKLKGEPRAKAG
jgi:guanylate kinase